MSIFKKIIDKIYQKKVQPEDAVVEPSGSVLIEYDSSSGDFTVTSEIQDMSEESISIFSYLIFHISTGELEGFIYESLKAWAEGDDEKMQFNEKLANQMAKLNALVLSMNPQETQQENDTPKVAIRASEVFNLKNLNEEG